MTYILGDLHTRKEEPFFSAVDLVFNELYTVVNTGDTIIQLGDLFHTYKPFPTEYFKIFMWINKFKEKGVSFIIMAGNNAHEYHHLQKTYAISPLASVSSVTTLTDMTFFTVEGITYFAIPWMPDEKVRKAGFETTEDYIRDFVEKSTEKADYLLYHYEDETVFMGGENHGIDFTFIEDKMPNIKRIGGHIHIQSPNYIGTPYQTNVAEIDQISRYYSIDKDNILTSYDFKQYVKYVNISFEDDIPLQDFKKQALLLTVSDAPSVDSVYEKFKLPYTYIRDVSLKFSEIRQLSEAKEGLDARSSIKNLLQEYIKTNKVDEKTSNYLLSLF